jgi:hypothetical protein
VITVDQTPSKILNPRVAVNAAADRYRNAIHLASRNGCDGTAKVDKADVLHQAVQVIGAVFRTRPQVPHPHTADPSRHGHGRSADLTERYSPRLVVLGERPSARPACAQIPDMHKALGVSPDRNRHTVGLTCGDRSDREWIGEERRSAWRPGCEVPDLHAMAVGADGHGHAVDVTDGNGPYRASTTSGVHWLVVPMPSWSSITLAPYLPWHRTV